MQQRKKYFYILILSLVIVIIITTIVAIRLTRSPSNTFIKQAQNEILSITKGSKVPINIQKQLEIVNNRSLSDQVRYKALENLAFYFENEYSISHNPSVRIFTINVIGEFAKKYFPKLYNKSAFSVSCADPSCGQELSPEIQKVLLLIKTSDIDERYKNTISGNLTTAGFMPDSNLGEKKYGFQLTLDQLSEFENPKASEAASVLRNYANQKYNFKL